MLEMVLRHMSSSEDCDSTLRTMTLRAIMNRGSMSLRFWWGLLDADRHVRHSTFTVITALHATLVKTLRLEAHEVQSGQRLGRIKDAMLLLTNSVTSFIGSTSPVWEGQTEVARREEVRAASGSGGSGSGRSSGGGSGSGEGGGSGSGDGRSGSGGKDGDKSSSGGSNTHSQRTAPSLGVNAWLQLQLLLVRSWVLVMRASPVNRLQRPANPGHNHAAQTIMWRKRKMRPAACRFRCLWA